MIPCIGFKRWAIKPCCRIPRSECQSRLCISILMNSKYTSGHIVPIVTSLEYMTISVKLSRIEPSHERKVLDFHAFPGGKLNIATCAVKLQSTAKFALVGPLGTIKRSIIPVSRRVNSYITSPFIKKPNSHNSFGINVGIALSCKNQTNDNKTDTDYG